jgi:hypothetical protein
LFCLISDPVYGDMPEHYMNHPQHLEQEQFQQRQMQQQQPQHQQPQEGLDEDAEDQSPNGKGRRIIREIIV